MLSERNDFREWMNEITGELHRRANLAEINAILAEMDEAATCAEELERCGINIAITEVD